VEKERAIAIVTDAVLAILGDSANVDNHVDLAEIGIDSLGFAELLGRLEDSVGRGCVTIDQIMDKRTVVDIAGLLNIGDSAPLAESATTRRAIARTPSVPKMPSISECGETASMKSWNVLQPAAMPKVEQAQPPSEFACAKSWICTTHVGSLPRPTDGNFEFERVIQQQVDAGIDIVNDGEWIRDNYIADVISRIEGLRGGDDAGKRQGCCVVHSMPIADDMKDVPLYAQRFTGGNGLITLNPKREAVSELACVSHPRYVPGEIPSLVPFVKALNKAGKSAQSGFFFGPLSRNLSTVLH
jgi:acyl carrier protein